MLVRAVIASLYIPIIPNFSMARAMVDPLSCPLSLYTLALFREDCLERIRHLQMEVEAGMKRIKQTEKEYAASQERIEKLKRERDTELV